MKNIAVFLNSPYLGGAERSILEQVKNLSDHNIVFFVPRVNNSSSSDVRDLINQTYPNSICREFEYPKGLYETSRTGTNSFIHLVGKLFGLLNIFLIFRSLNLGLFHTIWANGNKVGFPLYLYLLIFGYTEKFVWHFRDYPENQGVFKIIWKLLGKKTHFHKLLLANSFSVEKKIREIVDSAHCEYRTVYNPVGDINRDYSTPLKNQIKTIGVASMLAPWKGIHTLIQFEKMYRKELKEIGLEKISIFGGDIYSTVGEHRDYLKSLHELADRDGLIVFEGNKGPKEIFEEIDVLIHSSLRAEPFGRVIIEAFAARKPVISTCLGGSAELVEDGVSGLQIMPYDYRGIYDAIKKLSDKRCYESIVNNAIDRLAEVEEQQQNFWKGLY